MVLQVTRDLRTGRVLGASTSPKPHRELCPMPDTEYQLRMRGNHPRPQCKHRFADGKTAWRMSHMQIEGHPAESRRCALCRLRMVIYFEED